eukprot:366411-Chlamydomonas_euryale.AAC.2
MPFEWDGLEGRRGPRLGPTSAEAMMLPEMDGERAKMLEQDVAAVQVRLPICFARSANHMPTQLRAIVEHAGLPRGSSLVGVDRRPGHAGVAYEVPPHAAAAAAAVCTLLLQDFASSLQRMPTEDFEEYVGGSTGKGGGDQSSRILTTVAKKTSWMDNIYITQDQQVPFRV